MEQIIRSNIYCRISWENMQVFTYYCTLISRSRLYKYDDVVERVAQQLGLDDPSIIRLTPHNCYSQQPKPQPVKYRGVEHLSEMLVHYNQVIIDFMHNFSFCFLFKIKTSYFPSCMSDFGHIVLWSTWHPSARITRFENSESCISPCYQGWSEYIVIWFPFGFYVDFFRPFFSLFIQVVIHTIRLPKQSTVGDVLDDLKTKVILS